MHEIWTLVCSCNGTLGTKFLVLTVHALLKINLQVSFHQVLVELAELQDREVGDGTTSVVIIAAELLKVTDCFHHFIELLWMLPLGCREQSISSTCIDACLLMF